MDVCSVAAHFAYSIRDLRFGQRILLVMDRCMFKIRMRQLSSGRMSATKHFESRIVEQALRPNLNRQSLNYPISPVLSSEYRVGRDSDADDTHEDGDKRNEVLADTLDVARNYLDVFV